MGYDQNVLYSLHHGFKAYKAPPRRCRAHHGLLLCSWRTICRCCELFKKGEVLVAWCAAALIMAFSCVHGGPSVDAVTCSRRASFCFVGFSVDHPAMKFGADYVIWGAFGLLNDCSSAGSFVKTVSNSRASMSIVIVGSRAKQSQFDEYFSYVLSQKNHGYPTSEFVQHCWICLFRKLLL